MVDKLAPTCIKPFKIVANVDISLHDSDKPVKLMVHAVQAMAAIAGHEFAWTVGRPTNRRHPIFCNRILIETISEWQVFYGK